MYRSSWFRSACAESDHLNVFVGMDARAITAMMMDGDKNDEVTVSSEQVETGDETRVTASREEEHNEVSDERITEEKSSEEGNNEESKKGVN